MTLKNYIDRIANDPQFLTAEKARNEERKQRKEREALNLTIDDWKSLVVPESPHDKTWLDWLDQWESLPREEQQQRIAKGMKGDQNWFELTSLPEAKGDANEIISTKAYSFNELLNMDLEPGEEIVCGVARGEIGMLNAVKESFKTTLTRNLSVSMAAGIPHNAFGTADRPHTVAVIEGEDVVQRFREDVQTMVRSLSPEQQALVRKNLHVFVSPNLSSQKEREAITKELIKLKPDFISVDTLSGVFQFDNENDNAEITLRMKQLAEMAVAANAAVLATHHIGKDKAEEGKTRIEAYRAVGASAFSRKARMGMNLDKMPDGTVLLQQVYRKGPYQPDIRLRYNSETRWLEIVGERPQQQNNYDRVINSYGDAPRKVGEVVKQFNGIMSERTVKALHDTAIENGDLRKVGHGTYQKVQ